MTHAPINWEAKGRDLIGAFGYSLLAYFCVYFFIIIIATVPNSHFVAFQSWADVLALPPSIATGALRFFKAKYFKTMEDWVKRQ